MSKLGCEDRPDSRPTGSRSGALSAWLLAIPLACSMVTATQAQIRTDGTLGGPVVALAGPNFLINETLGRLAGSNLFHSFQVFNVGNAESATFVTTTPALANVVSRVTGGAPSQINGLIRLDSANAAPNFFFVNPAGVVFGQGARIDVPAGFHVSTADYLKFPDGNFHADPKAVSTLSSAAPEAFGFLGTARAAIAIGDGAYLRTRTSATGQPISIVAGDIRIENARVEAGGSDIRVVAAGPGAREVRLTGPLPEVSGDLDIVNGGFRTFRTNIATAAGDVLVAAGNVMIDGGAISSETLSGNGAAGNVVVGAGNTLWVVDGGAIVSKTTTSGNAGMVNVTARDIVIDGRGSGSGTQIASQADAGTGAAGNVVVTARGTLSVVDGASITADTYTSGQGGSVSVTAGKLSMVDRGVISSTTFGKGRGGTISVTADEIVIDGQHGSKLTGIASQTSRGTGDAGSVVVTANGRLSIVNGGAITADTFASGQAGAVNVTAGELSIADGGAIAANTFTSGLAGTINVTAEKLSIVDASIVAVTFGSGHAGAITVRAGEIVIDGRADVRVTGIVSQAPTGSTGNAGSVDVSARGTLSIVNAVIDSSTFGAGRAGSVTVSATTLVADSSQIGARAFVGSSGQTGTVTVEAGETITLSNRASFNIRNDATVANPGSLTPTSLSVTAPTITLASGSQITARSSGNVAASNIAVNFVGPQLTVSDASIRTSAKDGNGGSIVVTGTGTLVLQNGQITTSVAGTKGNGGGIEIKAPIMVMQTGFIQANTAAANASGGNVNIEVGTLLPSGGTLFVGGPTPYTFAPGVFGFNVIQAAAPTGVSGTIRISTPVLDITGSLSALPAGYLDAGGLGRSPCAIVGGSSLSQAGRGDLPPAAGNLLWIDPPALEFPPMPGAGSPGSGALLARVRGAAGTAAASTMIPCRGVPS